MTVALVIQGIGNPDTGKPYAFCYGDPPTWADYETISGLESMPQALGSSVSPLEGGMSVDAISWTVLAMPEMAQTLMRRVREARGQLWAAISRFSGTVDVAPRGRFASGDVVFIGREAILLGAEGTPGERYDRFSCTRGYLGTSITGHEVGPGQDDRLYEFPKLRLRPCYLVEDEVVKYYGIVETASTANSTTCIHITTRDVIGLFAGREFNKAPYTVVRSTAQGSWIVPVYNTRTRTWLFNMDASGEHRGDTHGHPNTYKNIQILNTAAIGWFYNGSNIPHPLQPPHPEIPRDDDGFPQFPPTEKFVELLCFGRRFVAPDGTYLGAINTQGGTIPVDGPVLHHPCRAYLHFLLSTGTGQNNTPYDFWGKQWGMGLPLEMVDVAGIEALISETPGLVVDNAMLGWDGKSWTAKDFILQTLIPNGLFPHTNAQGQASVSRLQVVLQDFVSIPVSQIEPMSEVQHQNLLQSHESVEGAVGMPWREPTTIIAVDKGRSTDLWDPRVGKTRSLNLSFYQPPDFDGEGGASEILEQYLQWVSTEIPTNQFVWVGPSEDPHPGMLVGVEVDSAWPDGFDGIFFTDEGVRQGSSTIKGVITSAKRVYSRGNVWEIGLWRVNSALIQDPREIPPSFVVTGTAFENVTVDRFFDGVDLAPHMISAGGVVGAGRRLQCWRRTVGNQGMLEVSFDEVGVSTISMDYGDFSLMSAIQIGDVLRLVPSSVESDSDPFGPGYDPDTYVNKYAHAADSLRELEYPDGMRYPGDIYV